VPFFKTDEFIQSDKYMAEDRDVMKTDPVYGVELAKSLRVRQGAPGFLRSILQKRVAFGVSELKKQLPIGLTQKQMYKGYRVLERIRRAGEEVEQSRLGEKHFKLFARLKIVEEGSRLNYIQKFAMETQEKKKLSWHDSLNIAEYQWENTRLGSFRMIAKAEKEKDDKTLHSNLELQNDFMR
jgi:hypothetical protein